MSRDRRRGAEIRVFVRITPRAGGAFVCVVNPEPRDGLTPGESAVLDVRTQVANGDLLKGVWAVPVPWRSSALPLKRACARALRTDGTCTECFGLNAVSSIGTVDYTPRS